MSWDAELDALAGATAGLLHSPARGLPLTDPPAALARRDTVVSTLRALVGAVSQVPDQAPPPPMGVFDVLHLPGPVLHQALAELPRAGAFGSTGHIGATRVGLTGYEQQWSRAAHASTGLEAYTGALRGLGPAHAWAALRDLADLAAAVPTLDHDLAQAILPHLTAGQDHALSYALLTHCDHDTLRLAATEIRLRAPVADRGPQLPTPSARPQPPGPVQGSPLGQALARYQFAVSGVGAQLSAGDLRAVSRLLETGSTAAAQVLQHAAPDNAELHAVAAGLRHVSTQAGLLRAVPSRSITVEHLGLVRGSQDLQAQLASQAGHAQKAPHTQDERQQRQLAGPALDFARHAPELARALAGSVRQALGEGLLLVPSNPDRTNRTSLAWVPAGTVMSGRPDSPALATATRQLTEAGAELRSAVLAAGITARDTQNGAATPDQDQDQDQGQDRAGLRTARPELRQTLALRLEAQPAPLSATLTGRHPGVPARPRPAAGPRR